MGLTTRELTLRRVEANRRNAQLSTGPRTAEGKRRSRQNAFKHGRYTQSLRSSMETLKEDPQEYETLLEELIGAHRPRNASERMLVEDIAVLRWQRRRSERAQAAKQARAIEALALERRRQAIELRRTDAPVPFAALQATGLRTLEDSPGKFRMLLNYLEGILAVVETRQFPPDGSGMLRTIYGVASGAYGLEILTLYDALVKSPPLAPEDHARVDELARKLRHELRCVTDEFELYKAEHVEISEAMRDSCLAPAGPDWRLLIRQMNSLDRNLDRKMRLLLEIQRRPSVNRYRRGPAPTRWQKSKQSIILGNEATKRLIPKGRALE